MEEIAGYIDVIVFQVGDTGFTVAKMRGKEGVTTIVGCLPSLQEGESLRCRGEWKNHSQYGRQFDVKEYTIESPSDIVGIQKYLESGLVRGIGVKFAQRIVDTFQEKTLQVIDETPDRLLEVPGLGKKKVQAIKECWGEQRSIRQVMIFLRSHGVSPGYAQKIYKTYGEESIEKVKSAPYQMAKDVMGIGFKMADAIAQKLGIAKNSPDRLEAGLLFVLWELSNEGHTCYPIKELIGKAQEILEVEGEGIHEAILSLIEKREIQHEPIKQVPFVWLKPLFYYEQTIAKDIARLQRAPLALRSVDIPRAIDWVQVQLKITLAEQQKIALEKSLTEKLHIITGGPGTGKSTITQAILTIVGKITSQIVLCAPTGRAAKRLTEITGKKAFTIHSMLEFDFKNGTFKRNRTSPLQADLLIVDEASMIDTFLMHYLLLAIPDRTRILFIGDIDQLPSVGAGNVLKDMIASQTITITRLTEIFRQAAGSRIITNAHKINQGEFPDLTNWNDFYFFPMNDPEQIQKKILHLVQTQLPSEKQLDPMKDIQVLSPMKKGIIGIEALNQMLQNALNPSNRPLIRAGRSFHRGDKVMQIKNNYDKKVYNGDIGRIVDIDHSEQTVTIEFEEQTLEYSFAALDEIMLAYAVSVHKFQGSECPCVIIPVHTCHFKLLHRNLLYTAVTRGKKLVIMIGSTKAIQIAINNKEVMGRYTGLEKALRMSGSELPLII